MRSSARQVIITQECAMTLHHWCVPHSLNQGVPMGLVLNRKCDQYRCQSFGLGWNSQGPDCEGQLEWRAWAVSHKFSGALNGVPLLEAFFFSLSGDIILWWGQTTNCSSAYQPSGRSFACASYTCWHTNRFSETVVVFSPWKRHTLRADWTRVWTCCPEACQCTGSGFCIQWSWHRSGLGTVRLQ